MSETALPPIILHAKTRDLGGFTVGRVLPAREHRAVGPFVFFDHMGPQEMPPGEGMDVRPHPHIGLATVTYLFAGSILHRDTLGSVQAIEPGAINWMTAGRGIAHSERTPPSLRATGGPMHGLQLWVGLPTEHEETAPEFHHHEAATLPTIDSMPGVHLRVLAGNAFGVTSPVKTFSSLFYVDAIVEAGGAVPLPPASEHPDRAVYVVEGELDCGGEIFAAREMAVFPVAGDHHVVATRASRVVLLGGAPLDGPRHMWWNFVSSSQARLDAAKRDWADDKFGQIPGDDQERIPLPTYS